MRTIVVIAIVALLGGCAHPHAGFVIKNFDDVQRMNEDFHPIIQIDIGVDGYPSAPKEVLDAFRARNILRKHTQDQMRKTPEEVPEEMSEEERYALLTEHGIGKTVEIQRIRWQIHPDAPLEKVAWLTSELTVTERSEFWTEHGIFIVSAPTYGGRRLPWLGKTSMEYRAEGNEIWKNRKPWAKTGSLLDSIGKITSDLDSQSNLGFVNLYFDFAPSSSWSEVESVLHGVLPQLDGMRGLWLGVEEEGKVTLHLHDAWKKEWRETTDP